MADQRTPSPPGGKRLTVAAAGAEAGGPLLGAVGVTPAEERLYLVLLDTPGVSLAVLADVTGLPRRKVLLLLESLQLKGLVTHSPERRRRYFPAPPEMAVEPLILRQQEALHGVRVAAAQLQARLQRAAGARGEDARVVEILNGRHAIGEMFEQMQRAARKEVVSFDRPPYVWSPSVVLNPVEFETLRRGVCYRAVYDHSALELPGAGERVRAWVEAGEQARAFAAVPLKLFAMDHRIALAPLDLQHPEGAAVLVRSSSLLDALYTLFESIWERATPIRFTRAGALKLKQSRTHGSSDADALLSLLATGLPDAAIARQLGVSRRTVERRIDALLQRFDAHNRFQLGWLAALRSQSTK